MTRDYTALSDHDFERLIADLLIADELARYETFSRGPDGGVDLRRIDDAADVHVVQCKHMRRSTFSGLLRAVRQEAGKLNCSRSRFSSYRLFTSQRLTVANKDQIANALHGYVRGPRDVFGEDEIEGLLNRHPEVERSHVKLWLSSSAQLQRVLHSGVFNRTDSLLADLRATVERYVETGDFHTAKRILRHEGVVVLSGPPGVGKSTLAKMLLADCVRDGFEPIELSRDVEDAWSTLDRNPQVFFFDDFLGSTYLRDRLHRNEDLSLERFVRRCTEDETTLLVMTSREHVLAQASIEYEGVERGVTSRRTVRMATSSYSTLEKGLILYNHLWCSPGLSDDAFTSLVANASYIDIVQHESYSPRLIEYATGLGVYQLTEADMAGYREFFLEALDQPERLWRFAFEQQIDDTCRDLVVVLVSLSGPCGRTIGEVDDAFECFAGQRDTSLRSHGWFRRALKVLEGTFVSLTIASSDTEGESEGGTLPRTTFVGLSDPGIEDFVTGWLLEDKQYLIRLLSSLTQFEQVEWCDNVLVARADLAWRKDLVTALASSLVRTWEFEGSRTLVGMIGDSESPQMIRVASGPVDRLRAAVDFMAYPEAWALLESWLRDRLDELTLFLEDGYRPDESALMALMSELREIEVVPDSFAKATLGCLSWAGHTDGWRDLARFRSLFPHFFSEDVLAEVTHNCSIWLNHRVLFFFRDIQNRRELDKAVEIAGLWGVEPNAAAYNEAVDYLASEAVQDDEQEERHAAIRGAGGASEADQRTELDTLFRGLTEG